MASPFSCTKGEMIAVDSNGITSRTGPTLAGLIACLWTR
jgi:hypothetical protein